MRNIKHPTYQGTDRPILIGDRVIQPLGRDHEHGTYPYTVTEVSERYVTIMSEVNGRSESAYNIFVQPADEESLARMTERLEADHIDEWRRDMKAQGVQILVLQNPHQQAKTSLHLVTLPKDATLEQMRVSDIVSPFVGTEKAKEYDRDDIYVKDVTNIKAPYELDMLVDAEVTHIEATPMTKLELAFEAMDRLNEQSYGETTPEVNAIEAAIAEMAAQLGIELPERHAIEAVDQDGWYDDWND